MSMEQTNQWKGYTLEELRMKRAKALIMTEVSKSQLLSAYEMAKSKTNSHGVRALLFNNNVLKGLKTTDYSVPRPLCWATNFGKSSKNSTPFLFIF